MLFQGRKMSKTLGNVIDPLDTIKEFGTDALRFTLSLGTAGQVCYAVAFLIITNALSYELSECVVFTFGGFFSLCVTVTALLIDLIIFSFRTLIYLLRG